VWRAAYKQTTPSSPPIAAFEAFTASFITELLMAFVKKMTH
jgi:hypothetical protein